MINMMLRLSDDLIDIEIFLYPSRIRHDTECTKLATSCTDRDKSTDLTGSSVHARRLRYDSGIFVSEFTIELHIITDTLHHQREEARIIDTEEELHIRIGRMQCMKHRIEGMINIGDIGFHTRLGSSLFDLEIGESDHIRSDRLDRSYEVADTHETSDRFLLCLAFDHHVAEIVLDHTTGDPDFLRWIKIHELASDFIFRFLSDRASIEDHDISFIDRLDIAPATVHQHRLDPGSI